jgi:hypothetical protein
MHADLLMVRAGVHCLLDCREMQPGRELSLDDIALCSIQRRPPEPKQCFIQTSAAKCGDECARHRLLQKAAFAEKHKTEPRLYT